MTGSLRVIATAGHVDHGKSAMIVALTGIDPDRFAEEKRRGLTIDLGYAWTTLPGGREVGFVDVPGHERFIRNMLAGVGPVRLVLFVVAADEGWKPQSEEHLQILDVLGVAGGVIALTKTDLVDAEAIAFTTEDVRERVAGTVLAEAPIVPVSARNGDGVEDAAGRARADRAGGTGPAGHTNPSLRGPRLLHHGRRHRRDRNADRRLSARRRRGGRRARRRAGADPFAADAQARPVRGLPRVACRREPRGRRARAAAPRLDRVPARHLPADHRVRGGGDDPCEASSASPSVARSRCTRARARRPRDLRVLERRDDGDVLLRIRTDDALALDVGDRFVLWESGRRRTVGGGIVLDVAPPRAADPRHVAFLARRAAEPDRAAIAALCIEEAGAIRTDELALQLGPAVWPAPADGWWIDPRVDDAVSEAVVDSLRATHDARPLDEGAQLADVRAACTAACRSAYAPTDPALIDALLTRLTTDGTIARDGMTVRLPSHEVALAGHEPELERLVSAIAGEREATPPTVKELVADGVDPSLIDAAARAGLVVRISPELVLSTGLVARATELVRAHASDGVTVSAIREHLGTSRKYAVPLAEWMDANGISRRVGDLRFPRETG